MSVFTEVERHQLVTFLQGYEVGELQDFEGISAGIENTNYFVDTSHSRYVLTLFEHQDQAELEFCLGLMAALADAGVPTAEPVMSEDGHALRTLAGKPAALVARLQGKAVEQPSSDQCRALGAVLAAFHVAGQSYSASQPNLRGVQWLGEIANRLTPMLPPEQAQLLSSDLVLQQVADLNALPQGVIHADLFRDNALFDNGDLVGVIDLYAACNDALVYDLAICVNDWCINADGSIDLDRGRAMIGAYHAARPLQQVEQQAWGLMLRRAALRFWLSRLRDKHFPRPGELTQVLDPDHFLTILRRRVDHPETLASLDCPAVA